MRILYSTLLLTFLLEPTKGSYWAVYEGDAPDSCVVADGEMVDATCCTDKKQDPQPLITDWYNSNCFVISGLLGDGGGSLMSYLGCDTVDGAATPMYGEGCYNNGENGGLIPDGTVVADTNATDIGECGCTFQVSGNGCHKIRDFSSLPAFVNDTRQVFLMMDETCGTEMPPAETEPTTDAPAAETPAPTDASSTTASSMFETSLAVLAAGAIFVPLFEIF